MNFSYIPFIYVWVLFSFLEEVAEVKSFEDIRTFYYFAHKYGVKHNFLEESELPQLDVPTDCEETFFALINTFLEPQTVEDIQMLRYVVFLYAVAQGFFDEEASLDEMTLMFAKTFKDNSFSDFFHSKGLINCKSFNSDEDFVSPKGDFQMSRWIELNRSIIDGALLEIYRKRGLNKSPQELDFYRNYLIYFDIKGICCKLPKLEDSSFDWYFLLQLIAGSFNVYWEFVYDGESRLKIEKDSGEIYLDELDRVEIEKMFATLIAEQIELESFRWQGQEDAIQARRQERLKYFQQQKRKNRCYQLLRELKEMDNAKG